MALKVLAGGSLFADRSGSGPPKVLALHGWGRDSSDFTSVLAELDALSVDLPGFGASPPPPEALGASGYARIVAEVLPEFPSPPVVIGHSFGGRVALALAVRRPVRALVLTGVPFFPRADRRRPSARFRLARLAHLAGLFSDRRMEDVRRRHGSADYRAARGVMRAVLVRVVGESYEADLGRLTTPVYLVWGADDAEVPPSTAERAADLLRSRGVPVVLEILPGVGHHVPLLAGPALRRAVEAALS